MTSNTNYAEPGSYYLATNHQGTHVADHRGRTLCGRVVDLDVHPIDGDYIYAESDPEAVTCLDECAGMATPEARGDKLETLTPVRPKPACGHTICVDRPLCAYTGQLTGVQLHGLEGRNGFLVLVLQDAKTALDKLRITRDVVDTIQASAITLAVQANRIDVVHALAKPFRSSFYANQAAELKARCQQQADKLWSEDNPQLPQL